MPPARSGSDRTRARLPNWSERPGGPLWAGALRLAAPLRARIAASPFSRNVSVLLISTVLGQVVGVALSPLLTRIFTPDEFGVLSIYSSVLLTFGCAACLRYEIAIPAARTETESCNLVAGSGLALLAVTLCFGLLCLAIPGSVLDDFYLGSLAQLRWLSPFGLFSIGLFALLVCAATRAQDFSAMARSRISQGFAGPISQILLGLAGLGAAGLAIGFIVGHTAGTTLLFKRMVVDRWESFRSVTWAGMGRALWVNRSYALISSWATVIDVLGGGALLYILIARFYPGPTAGFLFLSERLVARPLLMISNAMLTVFMSELGRYRVSDPAHLRKRFRQITSKQFLLGLAWVVVVNAVALTSLPLIFGKDWGDAAPFMLVISLTHLSTNVVQSVANTLQTLDKQVTAAAWQVGRVVAVFLGLWLCHEWGETALTAVIVYSAIQAVACAIMYLVIRHSIDGLGRGIVADAPA